MLQAKRRARLREMSGVTSKKSAEENEWRGVENSGESGSVEGSQSHSHSGGEKRGVGR